MTTVKKTAVQKTAVQKTAVTNGAILSAETLLQTTNVVANDIEVANKWKKLADLYIADGFTSKMLELDNKSYADTHNKIKTAILMAFDQQSRDLMVKFDRSKTDPKSKLSQFEQGIKDHLVRQIGSKYGKIVTHIKNTETSDQIKDKTKGVKTSKTPKDAKKKVAHYLDLAIRTLQEMKNPEIGVSTDIKTLQVIESKYKMAK
jgi:hypothetical protein